MENASAREQKLALKGSLFAGIQTAGGAALAVYTYKNSSRIWPIVYSMIAVGGTYNVFRNIRKIFWKPVSNEVDESSAVNNVATGTIIYFGSLYAFSEAWRNNHILWRPFLLIAQFGFFYAVSSTYRKKRPASLKPLLKCCQLAFEPALIVGGAIYLLYFRNHEEGWLIWFPLVATGFTGYKFAARGICRIVLMDNPHILLLKIVEILMGGCILTLSSITSAIYASIKEFHWSLKYFAIAMSFYGVFIIKYSILWFQYYLDMESELVNWLHTLILATKVIVFAFLMLKCTRYHRISCYMFPFLAIGGVFYQLASVYHIHRLLPPSLFIKYCERTLGLLLIVCGSSASAYIGYRFGWRYSLLTIPFIPAGIDYTYQGFSETDENE